MEPKNSPSNATQTASARSDGPLKVLRIEDVSVSIFSRERKIAGEVVTFYSVSFSRSYKDANGVRRYTKTFDSDDLGALVSLIEQASDYIHKQRENRAN